MWRDTADDHDFEDERQSSAYPRLSGRRTPGVPRGPLDVASAPDLSTLTDEEFHRRLDAMRAEHARTLAICDEVGLKGESPLRGGRPKNRFPVASVDADYTLSTRRYSQSPGPVYGDYARSSFRASPSPPTTRRSRWNEAGTLNDHSVIRKGKKEEALRLHAEGHRDDRMNRMQRYIDENIDFDDEDCDYDESSEGSCDCKCSETSVEKECKCRKGRVASHRAASAGVRFATKAPFPPYPAYSENAWKHRVTIPKPFTMTKRAESAVRTKSRTLREYEELREQQRWREMRECNRRISALPLPASTYLPLYERMREERERKRAQGVERRVEALREMQAPFSFDDRERRKHAQRHGLMATLEEMDAQKPNTQFKARPFPKQLFDQAIDEKFKMEEELRRSEAYARADDMMQSSALPPNMTKKRRGHRCHVNNEYHWHESSSPQHGQLKLEAVGKSIDSRRNGEKIIRDWSSHEIGVGQKKGVRWPDTNLQSNSLSRSLTDLTAASARHAYCSTPTHPSMCNNCNFKQSNWTSAMEQELERYEAEDKRRTEEAKFVEAVKAVNPSEPGCESIHCTEKRRPYLIPKKPIDKEC